MKKPWIPATSPQTCKERVVSLHGRRFTCEQEFCGVLDSMIAVHNNLRETYAII